MLTNCSITKQNFGQRIVMARSNLSALLCFPERTFIIINMFMIVISSGRGGEGGREGEGAKNFRLDTALELMQIV